ncbi:unnamed protein product, partial [Hapterophycus canaliculatus]
MGATGRCLQPFAATILSFSFLNFAGAELPDYPMTLGDMEVLAGYYTSDGKYLGGIPHFDGLSHEIYECTDFLYAELNNTAASNATVCAAWSADESYGELGTCECKFYASNGAYCSDWLCDQDPLLDRCCCCSDGNDSTFCQCDDDVGDSEDSLYCDSWSCKQLSPGGRVEYEEYHCQRSSPTGDYCEAWNGNVTASDEYEVVACECKANWNGDQVCSFWECEELGISTCKSAGASWCNLGVSVGVGGGIGFIGVLAICVRLIRISAKELAVSRTDVFVIMIDVLWCLAWFFAVVIWGGADGATYVGIMWGVPLAVTAVGCAYHCLRPKDDQDL